MKINNIKNFSVLFVEDEDIIRENIAETLTFLVKEVQVASNGKEALQRMKSFSPDIIISDLEMPIMDGITLIKEIRETNKQVLIIVLTAHTNQEYLLNLIDMHIECFITKPMNFNKLLTALKKCETTIVESRSIKYNLPLGYTYNLNKKRLLYKDEEIKLTKKEFLLIEILFKNEHRIVSYEELDSHIWEHEVMTENSIRSLVRHLRRKLPINFIENLASVGYKIV